MAKNTTGVRYGECERETAHTKVSVVVDLDGGSSQSINTGVIQFDAMLKEMASHGRFNLGVSVEGSWGQDDHYVVEDVGAAFGIALCKSIDNTQYIERYASLMVPVSDALVGIAVDMYGGAHSSVKLGFVREKLGDLATQSVELFFAALASHSNLNLHVSRVSGVNDHHVCEAAFIALGRAIRAAALACEGVPGPSPKGQIHTR